MIEVQITDAVQLAIQPFALVLLLDVTHYTMITALPDIPGGCHMKCDSLTMLLIPLSTYTRVSPPH